MWIQNLGMCCRLQVKCFKDVKEGLLRRMFSTYYSEVTFQSLFLFALSLCFSQITDSKRCWFNGMWNMLCHFTCSLSYKQVQNNIKYVEYWESVISLCSREVLKEFLQLQWMLRHHGCYSLASAVKYKLVNRNAEATSACFGCWHFLYIMAVSNLKSIVVDLTWFQWCDGFCFC